MIKGHLIKSMAVEKFGDVLGFVIVGLSWCRVSEHLLRMFVASGVWECHHDINVRYSSHIFGIGLVLCQLQAEQEHNW